MPNTFSLFEDFNDSVLNGGNWSYQGTRVTEHSGYMHIDQAVTDAGGKATYTFESGISDPTISINGYFHPGGNYYMGGYALTVAAADGSLFYINLDLLKSNWAPDYANDTNNFNHPRLTIGNGAGTDWYFSTGVTSSSFHDKWLDTGISINSTTGVFQCDIDGDGTLEFNLSNADLVGATLLGIMFDSYGWFTGHYSYINELAVTGGAGEPLATASEIFTAEGKLAFFAHMSSAAYHLASHEPTDPDLNLPDSPEILAAYQSVAQSLHLLGSDELAKLTEAQLDTSPSNDWRDMLGNSGDDLGVYTKTNAAAVVGRTQDAVFVAFRGTNTDLGLDRDHFDWALRSVYFNKVLPLLRAVRDYIEERNAAGETIDKIYLTGHSLGAAMVQPALEWFQKQLPTLALEGITFASPGYGVDLLDIDDDPTVNITNFWNAADIIQLGTGLSAIDGEFFTYNNVLENLLDGIDPFTAHSMQLYSDIADMLHRESEPGAEIDISGLKGNLTMTGAKVDRIAVSIQENSDQTFRIGDAKDFVMAGLFEFAFSAFKLLTTPITIGISWGKALFTAGAAAIDIIAAPIADPNVESAYDFAKSLFSEIGSTFGSIFEILYDASGLKFLVDTAFDLATSLFESDLVVGGAKDDLLFGLGGADVLFGGAGDDHLYGGWGRDILYGGNRNDILDGGNGGDHMYGGDGDDLYFVDNTRDRVFEGRNDGTDSVVSSVTFILPEYVERLFLDGGLLAGSLLDGIEGHGNDLDNIIYGDGWGNVLKGYGGADLMFGGDNGDKLYGGTQNDVLFGGDGKDDLFGGQDNDTLDGGKGKDTYIGGTGADTFVFASTGDIASDIIKDFEDDLDHIDLSGVSAAFRGGLTFSGTTFGGMIGEVIYEQVNRVWAADYTWVKIDLDGDGGWDERIKVMGLHGMIESDFIL